MIDEIVWLAAKRKTLKLTLRQVENDTKISNAYLSQLETGKIKKPSYYTIKTLTDYYNKYKVEPDKIKCPNCRSENICKQEIYQRHDIMTIPMGEFRKQVPLFSFNLCSDCGIIFINLKPPHE